MFSTFDPWDGLPGAMKMTIRQQYPRMTDAELAARWWRFNGGTVGWEWTIYR